MTRWPRAVLVSSVLVVAVAIGSVAGAATARNAPSIPKLTKLWTARLAGPGSAPVIADGKVFVTAIKPKIPIHAKGDGSFLYAFADTCAPAPARCPKDLVWRDGYPTFLEASNRLPTVITTPGVGNGDVYVGLNSHGADRYSGTEEGLAESTGVKVFSTGQGGTSAPTVAGGILYSDWQFTCCEGDSSAETEALNATNGSSLFTTDTDSSSGPTSPPAVAGTTLFVATDSVLNAFDASGSCPPPSPLPPPDTLGFPQFCAPIWSGSAGGIITGTPAVGGGEAYVGSSNGVLYAFPEAGCGSATCAPDWSASTGAAIVSSVAVSATTVFVGSTNGTLSAYPVGGCGSETCTPEWTATVGGSLTGPTVNGSLVFVASTNDTLDAFAAAGCGSHTCGAKWTANVGAPVDNAPAVGDGTVVVTNSHHVLRAYRLP
jgi:hypothetical protein